MNLDRRQSEKITINSFNKNSKSKEKLDIKNRHDKSNNENKNSIVENKMNACSELTSLTQINATKLSIEKIKSNNGNNETMLTHIDEVFNEKVLKYIKKDITLIKHKIHSLKNLNKEKEKKTVLQIILPDGLLNRQKDLINSKYNANFNAEKKKYSTIDNNRSTTYTVKHNQSKVMDYFNENSPNTNVYSEFYSINNFNKSYMSQKPIFNKDLEVVKKLNYYDLEKDKELKLASRNIIIQKLQKLNDKNYVDHASNNFFSDSLNKKPSQSDTNSLSKIDLVKKVKISNNENLMVIDDLESHESSQDSIFKYNKEDITYKIIKKEGERIKMMQDLEIDMKKQSSSSIVNSVKSNNLSSNLLIHYHNADVNEINTNTIMPSLFKTNEIRMKSNNKKDNIFPASSNEAIYPSKKNNWISFNTTDNKGFKNNNIEDKKENKSSSNNKSKYSNEDISSESESSMKNKEIIIQTIASKDTKANTTTNKTSQNSFYRNKEFSSKKTIEVNDKDKASQVFKMNSKRRDTKMNFNFASFKHNNFGEDNLTEDEALIPTNFNNNHSIKLIQNKFSNLIDSKNAGIIYNQIKTQVKNSNGNIKSISNSPAKKNFDSKSLPPINETISNINLVDSSKKNVIEMLAKTNNNKLNANSDEEQNKLLLIHFQAMQEKNRNENFINKANLLVKEDKLEYLLKYNKEKLNKVELKIEDISNSLSKINKRLSEILSEKDSCNSIINKQTKLKNEINEEINNQLKIENSKISKKKTKINEIGLGNKKDSALSNVGFGENAKSSDNGLRIQAIKNLDVDLAENKDLLKRLDNEISLCKFLKESYKQELEKYQYELELYKDKVYKYKTELEQHYHEVLNAGKDFREYGLTTLMIAIWKLESQVYMSALPDYLDKKLINYLFIKAHNEIELSKCEKLLDYMKNLVNNFRGREYRETKKKNLKNFNQTEVSQFTIKLHKLINLNNFKSDTYFQSKIT